MAVWKQSGWVFYSIASPTLSCWHRTEVNLYKEKEVMKLLWKSAIQFLCYSGVISNSNLLILIYFDLILSKKEFHFKFVGVCRAEVLHWLRRFQFNCSLPLLLNRSNYNRPTFPVRLQRAPGHWFHRMQYDHKRSLFDLCPWAPCNIVWLWIERWKTSTQL